MMIQVRDRLAGLTSLAALLMLSGGYMYPADKFPKKCVPFGAAAVHHPIDTSCGVEGQPDSDAGRLQNRAKTNYCATGTPQKVEIADFVTLQKAVDQAGIEYGNSHRGEHGPPDDRKPLTTLPGTLKEGGVVSMVAFMVDPHYSPKQASQ